ncbi:hypothetical protein TcasGA2_TC011971 [Tribolium castaneum]|uniref:Uncharacterized protein n=2 Tax=Tribolium castaneum TaxID=7070 RepID=D6X2U2_TRICA|nr:hypothetical protein TcasGA2_TC011971 [Tribolium castaneum]
MIQVLAGVVMLSLSIYIYVSVAPVLYSERAEISYVFFVIGLCGFNNICCYLFAIKIQRKCLKQSFKKSTRSLVFAWTCVTFYITIYLCILAKLTAKVYKHIIRAMGHSFYIGMSKYLKQEEWKVTIDRIQYDMQCCGAQGYREWHQIPWLGRYQVNVKSDSVKQFHENGSWLFPVTPWSCCRLSFPMQCLHDPLQQVGANHQSLVADALNTEGCITKLKIPIRMAITTFIILVVLNCLVQLVLFLVVRVLYTSCRNAEILETDGVAPGWIFGRGDCGYNRGKTLLDYMNPPRRRRRKQQKPAIDEQDC